jgi:hypothetical protein
MIEVRRNHRELMTDSKRMRDSIMRFCEQMSMVWGKEKKADLVLLLQQDLVVLAKGSAEYYARDALEAVNPFFPL